MPHEIATEFLDRLAHPVAIVAQKPLDPYHQRIEVVWPGQMDDPVDMALGLSQQYKSIYINLNPLTDPRAVYPPGISIRDSMIARRTRLLIDIDGHDVPKSEAERQKDAIKNHLGWPVLIETDSGNGYGLIYEIDLPNDQASKHLIRSFLEGLKNKFSCVDTSVSNAGRLTRLIGTLNDTIPTRMLNGQCGPD